MMKINRWEQSVTCVLRKVGRDQFCLLLDLTGSDASVDPVRGVFMPVLPLFVRTECGDQISEVSVVWIVLANYPYHRHQAHVGEHQAGVFE